MAVTATVPVSDPDSAAEAIVARYLEEPWVDAAIDVRPETRHVRATNRARIGIHREEGHLILMSVIDNLWKGASGQAIQNMNIRFGLGETTGLLQPGEL
jgi:N-acetyl-gamma-glutamyl-phosphate reductase